MTKAEREYLVLWLAQDLALLLKTEPYQREAYETLVVEIMDAIAAWRGWPLLSTKEQNDARKT
jgi:hypothetical protein